MSDPKNHAKRLAFTKSGGQPVDSDQETLTNGYPGFFLSEDSHMFEKLTHFNRERVPERVVHAKGSGAFGHFTVTRDLTKYTCAKVFSEVGKKTEVVARFSTVGGERGSADTARDPRGFAVRFYTEEGNYDMVGNNTPVFFIRDAIKFPDFIHTQKRNPGNDLKDKNAFWDFLSLTPESLHQVAILMSDRGTPRSYQEMDGFSSHTFMWWNEKGEYYWVKYHFKSVLGFQTWTDAEATEWAGKNPDLNREQLYTAIDEGKFPKWKVYVQIMTPEEAKTYRFDPFDVTKVWYHGDFPLIELGEMVLDRKPGNFFQDIEQAAFSPSNLVRGIGPSPDKMLQGRLFAYTDAHRWRLGTNHQQIPVNQPKCPMHNYQRDGEMRVNGNGGDSANYYPNTQNGPDTNRAYQIPPLPINGTVERHAVEIKDIDFEQPGELYRRALDDVGRANLVSNIVGHLGGAIQEIQYRQTALFYKADADWGAKVATGLKLDVNRVKELSEMSQEDRVKATMPKKQPIKPNSGMPAEVRPKREIPMDGPSKSQVPKEDLNRANQKKS